MMVGLRVAESLLSDKTSGSAWSQFKPGNSDGDPARFERHRLLKLELLLYANLLIVTQTQDCLTLLHPAIFMIAFASMLILKIDEIANSFRFKSRHWYKTGESYPAKKQ